MIFNSNLERNLGKGQPVVQDQIRACFHTNGSLAMVVWYKAIRALDLSKVTAIYLSYPVLALLISALVGFENITLHQVIGLTVTCAGAYWVSLTVKKEGH